jgi:hypothetical protein
MIDTNAYRPNSDKLAQSINETTSGERTVWYAVNDVSVRVDSNTNVVKDAIDASFWIGDCPAGKGSKELLI